MVGLGNPGPPYAATRHNVGAMVIDCLVERADDRLALHRRTSAELAHVRIGDVPAILARPRAFMNESGGPVAGLLRYFRVPVEQLVVVHDELDLPFGSLRLKQGGGDNGHNGLRSLRRSLGAGDFLRVRLGIGRPPGRMDPADYVLRAFTGAEQRDLGVNVERAADAVEALVAEGLTRAQNDFND